MVAVVASVMSVSVVVFLVVGGSLICHTRFASGGQDVWQLEWKEVGFIHNFIALNSMSRTAGGGFSLKKRLICALSASGPLQRPVVFVFSP